MTVTVVRPTTSNNDSAHATAGRIAQPVHRRTAVSRWMDRERTRSRTLERNCTQSGSGMSSSIELTPACTDSSACHLPRQSAHASRCARYFSGSSLPSIRLTKSFAFKCPNINLLFYQFTNFFQCKKHARFYRRNRSPGNSRDLLVAELLVDSQFENRLLFRR